MATRFTVKGLRASIEGKEILKGIDLEISGGEIHAIMGPNGTGKSTLASALMGHPKYEVTEGEVMLNGENCWRWKSTSGRGRACSWRCSIRAKFPGVTNADFLRSAINARRGEGNEISLIKFIRKMEEKMKALEMDPEFMHRYLNEGFSGGEKKRNEILQMMMLEPKHRHS